MEWPTLGQRTAKEQNRTEQKFQMEDEAQAALDLSDQLLLNASSKDDAMLACFCLAKLSAR